MSLADTIRMRLAEDATHSASEHVLRCAIAYSQALTAVLDEHKEWRIYEPCGHTHNTGDPGTREVDDVGLVCESGYLYSICWGCCTGKTGFQSEVCAADHEGCWPCHTVETIARALGIDVPAVTR
jgi:hypothetical protein